MALIKPPDRSKQERYEIIKNKLLTTDNHMFAFHIPKPIFTKLKMYSAAKSMTIRKLLLHLILDFLDTIEESEVTWNTKKKDIKK